MRMLFGLGLILIGGAVLLYGGGSAVKELVSLYSGAMTQPMEDPQGGEAGVSDRMMRGVKIGAAGAVPFVIGSVLVKSALFARALRKSRAGTPR